MRVAVYYNNRDIRIEERPKPQIGPEELLVQVEASGICGSDVMEWYRIKKAPLVLGHEIAGRIVSKGDKVEKFKVGDRVFVSHHVPCNTCRYCLAGHHAVCETLRRTNIDPGGFSEFIRVPSINVDRGVFLLPDSMSFEEGALIEPLACTVRALRLARFQPAQTLMVVGCGVSGLLFILLARALGAGRIAAMDINEYRLNFSKKLGANAVIHANENVQDKLRQLNDGWLADLVTICTGAPSAVAQSWQYVERGGTIVFFAPPNNGADANIPIADLWKNEVTILTSYAAAPSDITNAMELIGSHKIPVSDIITHRMGLKEIGKGFQLVEKAQDSLKVIINPQN